jgi:N-glycosylase/DNA lyase
MSTSVQHPPATAGDAGWETIWPAYRQAYEELIAPSPPAGEPQVRRELLFCLLGGHSITYELGRSALAAVEPLDVFDPRRDSDSLRRALSALLEQRRFDPPCADGTPRRYRFPNRKAKLICAAREWVLAAGELTDRLADHRSELERRRWLQECPGVGAKSASWLLRNTGWAARLAILDVHVLRAMRDAGIISEPRPTERYELTEQRYLDWCTRLGAAPAVFDLFLWEYQRGGLTDGPAPRVR